MRPQMPPNQCVYRGSRDGSRTSRRRRSIHTTGDRGEREQRGELRVPEHRRDAESARVARGDGGARGAMCRRERADVRLREPRLIAD